MAECADRAAIEPTLNEAAGPLQRRSLSEKSSGEPKDFSHSQESPSNMSRIENVKALFRDKAAELARYLSRRVHSPEQVRDLFQEVWKRLLETREPVQDEVKFLFGTANNVIREHVRAEMRARKHIAPNARAEADDSEPLDELSLLEDRSPGPEAIIQWRRTAEVFETALNKMDARHRAVFILRDVDGLSIGEIASQCDISVHKVERLIREARVYVTNFIMAREKDML
jgi:RNA polymerase sigma factor (sigma-70 family)